MTIETLTRAQLVRDLGYIDSAGNPSDRAIAQFMRDAMVRWGICPKRAILKHAREQLRAGDVTGDTVPRVFERLLALGECTEVAVGHDAYVVPAEPCWISSGGGLAVLLGPVVPTTETPRLMTIDFDDVVVRVHVESEEQAGTLEARGARQVSLAEWLNPLAFLDHASRRAGDAAVRADRFVLSTFWERLVELVSVEGLQIDSDAELRAVAGEPGGFFGRHTAPTLEGRWREDLPDGVWCGYRRGHGEGHWLPTLVSVNGHERRAFDLFNDDEWRWALLARSRAVGRAEVIRRVGDDVQVTWPLPAQIRAAMEIVGVPSGPWRWRVADDSPDLWALLK